jgi:hypothetical protein
MPRVTAMLRVTATHCLTAMPRVMATHCVAAMPRMIVTECQCGSKASFRFVRRRSPGRLRP